MALSALFCVKKQIILVFQDEKWIELLPSIERCWTKRGQRLQIPTLGYTARRNFFISLVWPDKKIIWNCFEKRTNIEFRKYLGNLAAYAKRHKVKRIILFVDHATYHKTPAVKKFVKEHSILRVKCLGKKDPNYNPVEPNVNKKMHPAVSVNKSYKNIKELEDAGKKYLMNYLSNYDT